jgi:hypothetical protein
MKSSSLAFYYHQTNNVPPKENVVNLVNLFEPQTAVVPSSTSTNASVEDATRVMRS